MLSTAPAAWHRRNVLRRLVALSTLFTKQHYIADVIAGVLLAVAAYVVFLRKYPRDKIPELDRRLAPVLAVGVIGIVGLGVATFWLAYQVKSASWLRPEQLSDRRPRLFPSPAFSAQGCDTNLYAPTAKCH